MIPNNLPAPARRRLQALQQAANDATALTRAAIAARSALGDELQQRQSGILFGNAAEAEAAVADLEREIAAAQASIDARHNEERHIKQVLAHLTDWLGANASLMLQSVEPVVPKLKKSETVAAALDRTRTMISSLQADLSTVSRAPAPPDDLKAQVPAIVADLAKRFSPKVQSGGRLEFAWYPDATIRSTAAAGKFWSLQQMAWLFPEQLEARLLAEIDAQIPAAGAMTEPAKLARISDLTAQLFAAGLLEEALIQQCLKDGVPVRRRIEADPRAVLGIK